MIRLSGKKIYLRALEPEDLDFLYALENDPVILDEITAALRGPSWSRPGR